MKYPSLMKVRSFPSQRLKALWKLMHWVLVSKFQLNVEATKLIHRSQFSLLFKLKKYNFTITKDFAAKTLQNTLQIVARADWYIHFCFSTVLRCFFMQGDRSVQIYTIGGPPALLEIFILYGKWWKNLTFVLSFHEVGWHFLDRP